MGVSEHRHECHEDRRPYLIVGGTEKVCAACDLPRNQHPVSPLNASAKIPGCPGCFGTGARVIFVARC